MLLKEGNFVYILVMDKNKFVLSVLIAVVGLLMILNPGTFIAFAVIMLGAASVIDGIFIMVATRNLVLDPNYRLTMTIRGILNIAVGAVAVILPLLTAAVIWKIMAYVLGGYLLVSAGLEVYGILKLHRNGIMIRQSLIETIVLVILAVVLFVIPSKTAGNIIVRICGIALIISGLVSALLQWRNRPITVVPDSVTDEPDSSETSGVED